MRSLRLRLLSRTTIVLVLTLTMAAVALYWSMRTALLAALDSALLIEAQSLQSHVEQRGAQIHVELEEFNIPEYAAQDHPHFYEVRAQDGRSIARSPSLNTVDLAIPADHPRQATFRFVTLPNRRRGRQIVVAFEPRIEDHDREEESAEAATGSWAVLAVARDTAGVDGTLATLLWTLMAVTLTAMGASVALTSGVVERELRPLTSLARTIEGLGAADLATRIELADCPVELAPVVQRLNELLGRLDNVLTREKSFTADVAHELRTPLAGLQTALEVCASRPRDAQTYQDVVGKCLRIAHDMHAMVENLLNLARAEAGQLIVCSESVDLPACLRECWQQFEAAARQRRLRVEWNLAAVGPLETDRDLLRRVVTNLFENAVNYSEDGGWIRIATTSAPGSVVVRVENNGCRLSPADAGRVFDRFWRGDAARSAAGTHCGLGLSVCRKIVGNLHGSIGAEIADSMFAVCVTLPVSAPVV
jgi:heavy metal sensor kinase